MSNVLTFPVTALEAPASAPPIDHAVVAFETRCFEAYRNRNTSRGFGDDYADRCLTCVRKLMQHSQKPLGLLTAADYEAWTTHLAKERGLLSTTQRTYQTGVRQVFKHLVARTDLQNEAVKLFGRPIELVAHRENSIVHKLDDEAGSRRPPLSHDQMEQLFEAIDRAIDLAEIERPRAVRALKRDYTMIFTGYVYGLRLSELADLRPDDWRPCPDVPELGKFALLHVRKGKGSKGSGKRSRVVPTSHATYPAFLQWYLTEVRPAYQPGARSNEPLFFSEKALKHPGDRCQKVSGSTIEKAFKKLVIAAGLDPTIFSPHSLRRSMCQHEMMRAPTEYARAKAGHQSAATTQIYGQVPLEHQRKATSRLIRQQLQNLQEGAHG